MLYVFGDYTLDTERCELRHAGENIGLRPKVYDVLAYLVTHRHRVIPKAEFLERLWPGQFVGEASLSSCIMAARKAVGDSGRAQHSIKTVHGRGFRFIALVAERPPQVLHGETGTASEAPAKVREPSRHRAASPSQGEGTPDLAQPPLVARTQQLDSLAHFLHEAIAGQPRLVLIQGEAGIGKTRLLKELQAIARHRGAAVCYGRCHENLPLPYMPFIESLLAYLEASLGDTTSPLDGDMERLRRLCHHTSATPTATNVAASARLDQDKLRLFLAVSRLTVRLAQRHPLVFLLDDLHWADQPSLELFGHLVFTVADAVAQEPIPLLIAGTYRPLEASPWLTRCLSRFQRESICRTVELSGFADADIVAFLQEMQVGRPSTQLITTMQQVTHGNPLFIQEVIHNLRQNDALHQRGGYLVASASAADVQLPEHITGVFAARLETLNEDCRRALTLAAFLGDRFSLPVLSAISGFGEEELLDVLEEGMHQRLLLNEDQDFQFAHPLIRHVFYHAPSVARRQRLHHWLAQALERLYADNLEAHILEIAHHLIRAGPVAEADTVAVYARRAGDRAFTAFAWDDAARYYEAALTAAESTGHLPDHDRADFHYQVAQAYHRAMDTGPGLDHYDRAIEAYQRTGDRRGLGLTLMEKARLSYYTAASHGTLIDVQPLEEVLELLGSDAPDLHGNIAAIMAEAYWVGQQVDKAEEMARYALATGRGSGDDRLCAQASHVLALVQALGRRRVQDALESWQNALVYARQADDLWLQGLALPRMALSLTMLGRLDEAEAIIQQARTVTHTTQDWSNYSLVLAYLAAVQVARGHFAAAEQHAQETLRMVSRSHYPWGGSRALFTVACAHALRGHWTAAEDALNMQVEPGRIFDVPGQTTQLYVRIFRQLLRSYAGAPLDEALESLAAELAGAANADAHPLALFCAMAEIAAMTATPTVATPAYQTMFVSAARHVVFTSGWMFLVPRVLGVVATLNRWWDKAETHFHTAIEVASGIGAQPELGRTYLDYARMLTARGSISDHDRAIELAKQACTIFHAYGMHPFAQGAEQLAKMRHSRTS